MYRTFTLNVIVGQVIFHASARTKRFHALGSDLQKAETQARQLNVVISQQIIEKEAADIINRDNSNSNSITVGAWVKEYLVILQESLDCGAIKLNTHKQKHYVIQVIDKKYGKIKLGELTALAISKFLKSYVQQGKNRIAQQIRSGLIDLFAEAIAAGHFPADKPNPASVIKKPRAKVKRARLTLEVFKQAISWATENLEPYQWKAILLGVLTAQRLGDIRNAKLKDVRTVDGVDYLAVQQGKTGTKILIPLSLRLESIGYSVGDVVNLCRDRVLSPYLLHH
ncbi:MAG: hypothetical protein V7731_13415 [Amphritea sp.]